ncbi:MAG: hypothetical protein GY862_13660, partial [Gammaproteobacteria bacterium]|nr:hypothetical protein [Gammaproteobacteria bacterium]
MKLFQSFWKILFVLPVLCAGVPGAAACPASGVAYVDSGVARTGTGNSWRDAFSSLQAALDCGTVREIHAAAGVYRPSSRTEASDPRSATFKLRNNLKIYGGYPPGGGVRDWQTHRTVLSGDIDANDITDGNGTTVSIQGANSYHVAISENMDDTAMLDGFIITGGQATAKYPKSYGGGMTNRGGSPVLANLIFSGNQAIYGGGL